MTKARRITVTWVDSRSFDEGGWMPRVVAEAADLHPIQTTGYLVHENESRIVLCQSLGEECVAGVMAIPRACILLSEDD